MKKYLYIFSLYWQEGLQRRSSFFTERFRSLVVLLSFYFLWTTLLADRDAIAGYTRSEMLTYVFGMNVLRSLVFAGRTDEISYEINRGQLSAYLLKPVNFVAYTLSRDLSEKSINLVSAVCEVLILAAVLNVPFAWPQHLATWLLFATTIVAAIAINFLLSFVVGCWGFWTAESGGPRFFLELVLEFSAGAFFPLTMLPAPVQQILAKFPSPYLVFFPLNVFLEKLSAQQILFGFATQTGWILLLGAMTRWVWLRGLRVYSAQGS
jgi:ABC-2 type transport system permease protein